MGYQARWGPKGFIISTNKIVALEGLTTSYTLKRDTNTDTEGTAATNTKGKELQPISFSARYAKALGTDPRGQLDEWEKEVGNAYPLYIGGKLFGPKKLQLESVSVSETSFANDGTLLASLLTFSFLELSSTSDTNATSGVAATGSKTEAFSAKPSAQDKHELARMSNMISRVAI